MTKNNFQMRTWLKERGYLVAIALLLILSSFVPRTNDVPYESAVVIVKEKDEFTPEKFKQYLHDLKVNFPEIVYAQAMLETGGFRSAIFRENNNLFGMKQAEYRATTCRGTNRNHAYYKHWRESVLDYALYQSRYLSDLETKGEYFQYLDATYAEVDNYSERVKRIIKEEKHNVSRHAN